MAKKRPAKPTTPKYPVNPALEAAVIANAEDDTQRLVYADWLVENGDPDRVAFIRTQVALWDKHPADPDYVNLIDRQEELDLLSVGHRLGPTFPPELECRADRPESLQRGYPFIAHERSQYKGTSRELVLRIRDELPTLLRSTTIRGFQFWLLAEVSNPLRSFHLPFPLSNTMRWRSPTIRRSAISAF
jgi:uncharacterized protein (TIGR02996 family)